MKHVWGIRDKETKDLDTTYVSTTRQEAREDVGLKEEVVKLVPEDSFVKVAHKMPEEKIDITKLAKITEDVSGNLIVDGKYSIIEERRYDEFSGNAVWLDDAYNWKIVKDSTGELCLLATKKESI